MCLCVCVGVSACLCVFMGVAEGMWLMCGEQVLGRGGVVYRIVVGCI